MKTDRRKKISELLNTEGIVYLNKLGAMFPEVTLMTLRRDLDYLESIGEAVRIHGGAQKKTAGSEPFYNFRAGKNREKKIEAAKNCLRFIEEGRTIYIDCGTTAMEIARNLPDVRLNVITGGPNIAMEASRCPGAEVVVLGGKLNGDNFSISGEQAMNFLDTVNIDVAFIAASGFAADAGFTCGSYNEREVKRKVLSKAQKKVMFMDDTKFGKRMMFTFATENDVDYLVTNATPPENELRAVNNAGLKLIY